MILLRAQKIHENLEKAIEAIVKNKEQYVKNPSADFTRNRKLTMTTVVKEILSMRGGSLKKELHHFSELHKIDLTPSAFVQQRSKISSMAFKDIFNTFNNCCDDPNLYKGYRLLAVDGSDIDRSRDPNLDSFMVNANRPEGFNKVHLNALYDLCNKTYFDVLLQPTPKEDEHEALEKMLNHNTFDTKSIIIADRGYEGYNTLAHLINTDNVDFICRARHGYGGLKKIRELPMRELDEDITVEIATTQTKEDKVRGRIRLAQKSKKKTNSPKTTIQSWDFSSPYVLNFRVVRFLLDTGEYETIITSLKRDEFSVGEIKELYHLRWGIETSFRELKYAVGLINLHCKKEDLVVQEIYASLIMYNYCSRIAGTITNYNHKKTVHEYKVNFTMAIHLCREFYEEGRSNFQKLLIDIGEHTEPIRSGRRDKRKNKPKGFVGFTYRVAA